MAKDHLAERSQGSMQDGDVLQVDPTQLGQIAQRVGELPQLIQSEAHQPLQTGAEAAVQGWQPGAAVFSYQQLVEQQLEQIHLLNQQIEEWSTLLAQQAQAYVAADTVDRTGVGGPSGASGRVAVSPPGDEELVRAPGPGNVVPNPIDVAAADRTHAALRLGSAGQNVVVAYANVREADGTVTRVMAINEAAWRQPLIDESVIRWAMGQAGEQAQLLNDPGLLSLSVTSVQPGSRHAENYIEGYIRSHPGSRLQSIGTSWFGGGFCSICQKIVNTL